MAKAILICGRIAGGKTTYAQKLCREQGMVSLSCDELMLALFDVHLGAKFDEVSGRAKRYLYDKALELLGAGVSVVLDWGFWTPTERRYARSVFESKGYPCEIHYIDTPDELWMTYIARRNLATAAGSRAAYPVDEGLLLKFRAGFSAPERDEVDVWVKNEQDGA